MKRNELKPNKKHQIPNRVLILIGATDPQRIFHVGIFSANEKIFVSRIIRRRTSFFIFEAMNYKF